MIKYKKKAFYPLRKASDSFIQKVVNTMSELLKKPVLIIDCQTTGMHPNNGHLLQIGWAILDPEKIAKPKIEKRTLSLPESEVIPPKIMRMLQITKNDLLKSVEPKKLFKTLQIIIQKLGPNPVVFAHYAQFEKNFLRKLFLEQSGSEDFNFELYCSQKIAKRLLPNIPSHNLKAIAGYLELENTPKNEVKSHVSMTIEVVSYLLPKLIEQKIENYKDLNTWLNKKTKALKQIDYDYNIERSKRLSLPERPGIYRMLAKDGSILYIGKATSLRARVNSYFRGTKNRDRRKLEMLAQVWDIDTVECETALEATLLESDEIKKWSPPYNILLKAEERKVFFYDRTFCERAEYMDKKFSNGPFRPFDAIDVFFEFIEVCRTETEFNWHDELITADTMRKAWSIFCNTHIISYDEVAKLNNRQLLTFGLLLLRRFERQHGRGSFKAWWSHEKNKCDEDQNLEEKLSARIWRLFIRAAEAKVRSKDLLKISNSNLIINQTNKRLNLRNGEITKASTLSSTERNFCDIEIYDRLTILWSAKIKNQITFCK